MTVMVFSYGVFSCGVFLAAILRLLSGRTGRFCCAELLAVAFAGPGMRNAFRLRTHGDIDKVQVRGEQHRHARAYGNPDYRSLSIRRQGQSFVHCGLV
ncbi:MAG: hypothetical protein AB7O79_08730 [Xanthobacteraceae bacterium]